MLIVNNTGGTIAKRENPWGPDAKRGHVSYWLLGLSS